MAGICRHVSVEIWHSASARNRPFARLSRQLSETGRLASAFISTMIEGEVSIPPLAPDLNEQFEVICKCVRNLGTTFGAGRFISRQQRTAVPVCNVVPGALTV